MGKVSKILAGLGMLVLSGAVFGVLTTWGTSSAYSGLDTPIDSNDGRFFYKAGGSYTMESLSPPYPASTWGWSSYDNNVQEAQKHSGVPVFYKMNNGTYGQYYSTPDFGNDWTVRNGVMTSSVVHCPSGATIEGPHNSHMGGLGGNGLYDGSGHYWCSQGGVGVNPLPGPETGKSMPDMHVKTALFKAAGYTNKFTFAPQNWSTKLQTLSTTNGGYVKCKYTMSGPFGSDNHYHCLTADGSREADIDAGGEDILITAPPPTCTLTLNDNKTSYTADSTTFVNYTYTCSEATSVAVQLVKPDGTATIYNTATNITTSTMGFGTSNLTAGSHTLKICVGDNTCSSSATFVSVPFTITAPSFSTAANSMIGYWKFNGNGNNEVAGAPTAATVGNAQFKSTGGKADGYLYLPAGSDSAQIPWNSAYDLPNAFTVSFWFRQRSDQSVLQDLVYKGSAPNSYNFRIFRQLWNQYNFGPIITGYTANGTGYWSQTSNGNTLSHNTWHHVSYSKSATGAVYYLDGAEINRLDTTGSTDYAGAAKIVASLPIVIGGSAIDTDIDDLKIYNYAISASEVVANGPFPTATVTTTTTGAGAPEPASSTESGVWAQVDIATGAVSSTAICTKAVCGLNGEYHGYVPPPTYATGSTWWPTSKRYIWQMAGQAGYSTGTFDFNTYKFTVAGGTIYNGVFTATPSTGTTATTNSNWVQHTWTFSNGSSQSYILKRTDSEYLNFIATVDAACRLVSNTSFTWNSGAGDDSAANWRNFGIPNCGSTTTSTTTTTGGTTTTTNTTTTTTTTTTGTARACGNGEKCASGSWCSSGQQCYYPDNQLTCVAWPAPTVAGTMPAGGGFVVCPSGTSICGPNEADCVAPGQTVSYTSTKWCRNGQSYYSSDGTKMTCLAYDQTAPAGYSTCRPSDTSCIAEGKYGPSTGWCSSSMKCYQKTADQNANNDTYCAVMPRMTATSTAMPADSVSCPTGYSVCSPTDANCKQKGDTWTDANTAFYCTNSQKCTTSAGGGTCVGWSEQCPSGTKYCSATDQYCVEPGEYKTISGSSATGSSYWCGGGGGMTFYSSGKAYCEPKKAGSTAMGMMWTSADIKAILAKLGSGWGVCRPGDSNCIEPGKTGPSTGWCGWTPPGTYMPYSSNASSGGTRSCPGLDDTPTDQTVIPTPVRPVAGTTTIPVDIPMPPVQRICGPSEMPDATNMCVMQMYRWNIDAKNFEKCDSSKPQTYTSVQSNTKSKYTNCESFNFELEREWRTERFLAHDPRKDGEWYMPPWDASATMMQYDPATDTLTECKAAVTPAMNSTGIPYAPIAFQSPCMPYPESDRSWLLKKARAEYTMWKSWQSKVTVQDTAKVNTLKEPTPVKQITPVLEVAAGTQCKVYLRDIKQKMLGDKAFWKQINNQYTQIATSYENAADVKDLLDASKKLILELDSAVKAGKCDNESLTAIQEKTDELRGGTFSELSAYLPEMQDFAEYGQCRVGLTKVVEDLKSMLKNQDLNAEEKASAQELVDSTTAKLAELAASSGEFDYDAPFECQTFSDELNSQISSLTRSSDKELNRIIDDVVAKKLEPVMAELTARMEERGKKIDELLVQVAELHKTVESISKAAEGISEKITTSYNSLAQIEDKFAAQKAEIQETKGTLIALVEKTASAMKTTACISKTDRERMIQEFGTVASVNWFGERSAELENKLNLFMTQCAAKDVSSDDVSAFISSVDSAATQNMTASYTSGMTRFADVPTHEWYFGAMQHSCYQKGMPGENALKQDALLMVLRTVGAPSEKIEGNCKPNSNKVTASAYAVCAVNYAIGKGVSLSGSMTEPADRVEVAGWLNQLADLKETANPATDLKNYSDVNALSPAQKESVANVVKNGIMTGNEKGGVSTFQPYESLTRAALATVLERLGGADCSAAK